MFRLFGALLLGALAAPACAQSWFASPLSPRTANYTIDVTLDPRSTMLHGEEVLLWHNPSADAIQELQFHLYLNAFRDERSTLMRERGGTSRHAKGNDPDAGWIVVNSIRTMDGEELSAGMEFIQPDDGNEYDRTAFRLPLRRPIPPRQALTLRILFTAKLPRVTMRTGFYRDFFMVAQWFPKVAVYEPAGTRGARQGQWNCHQFHRSTEFYADFGTYDVRMTVPASYIVGATGSCLGEERHGDTTKTVIYHAEDVHDFAWTASPHFVEVTDHWQSVAIRALMQPQHMQRTASLLSVLKASLAYFDAHVGKYPYPVLTMVDPAYDADGASGMEYPTMFTILTHWLDGGWLRLGEVATVHEFGHNYWYGLVASNEAEEAWLDEGINQYFEGRIMDETYGKTSSFLDLAGVHAGDIDIDRVAYCTMNNPKAAPLATPAWLFPRGPRSGGENYGTLTYFKTATVLTTLERMIGRATMDSVMHTYFQRWSFRHPGGRDFIATANEVVRRLHGTRFGESLDWFFNQTIYGTDICDYELSALSITALPFEAPTPPDTLQKPLYESTVLVSRLGEVRIPVNILMHFENGSEVLEEWAGDARVTQFTYRRPERIAWAQVDPDNILAMDINRLNNSKSFAPPAAPIWKYTTKLMFWLQNLLHTVALLG